MAINLLKNNPSYVTSYEGWSKKDLADKIPFYFQNGLYTIHYSVYEGYQGMVYTADIYKAD